MTKEEKIKAIAVELWKASTDKQSEVYNEWYATKFTQGDIENALREYTCSDWRMKYIERNDSASRERELDKEWLFGDIDKMQRNLKRLKDEGFSEIEEKWCGYEDNYFVAVRYECEEDDEYYIRLQNELNPYLREIEDKKCQIVNKKKRIEELEKEIQKLKKEIK